MIQLLGLSRPLPKNWLVFSLAGRPIMLTVRIIFGIALTHVETIESGIAINAAERTDSDCAQQMPLHGAAPMRTRNTSELPHCRQGCWGSSFILMLPTARKPISSNCRRITAAQAPRRPSRNHAV